MKKIISFLVLFSIIITLFSCSKHKGDVLETPATSTITINDPVANTVYHYGDTININASAIASNNLHGYDLRITKRNDTASLYFYHGHEHNTTLQINAKWANTVSSPADLVLTVLIYLDHNGNTNEKKVALKVQ